MYIVYSPNFQNEYVTMYMYILPVTNHTTRPCLCIIFYNFYIMMTETWRMLVIVLRKNFLYFITTCTLKTDVK